MTRIRAYRAGDGVALRALWESVGFRSIGDDDDHLDTFAARNPGLFLVAEGADGTIVASTMGAWDGRRGWLYHVATAPGQRGSGLASDLIGRAEDGLRALGAPRVLVIVEMSNPDAVHFWRARGYEIRDTHQMGKSL